MWRGERLVRFKMRKTLAALAYLAAEGGIRSRERLATLLWPSHDLAGARKNLRTTVAYLRQALGDGVLVASQEVIGLDPTALRTLDLDLDALAQAQRLARAFTGQVAPGLRAQLERAMALFGGHFLEGLELSDAPDFESWVAGQRAHWLGVIAEVLERLAALQAEAGDLGAAQATLERWTTLEPGEERAWQRLLALALERGDLVGAGRLWATCQAALADLDAAPGKALTTLAARIDAAVDADRAASASRILRDVAGSGMGAMPLVGRADQLAALRRALARAQAGQAQVLVLQGEAGIGKTRLATAFLTWAQAQGADVLAGRALETEGNLPYAPVVAALRPRLECENAPDDLLGDLWLAELAHLLPELCERYPDLPPVMVESALGQGRLFEAVTRLGQALAARRPLVLFLDDMQWADGGTRDLVHYVVRQWAAAGTCTLVVLAARTEDIGLQRTLAQWLGSLERETATVRLELEQLTSQDVVRLVAALAEEAPEDGSQPAEVAAWGDWLAATTCGQPYFMTCTLHALLDEGVLRLRPAVSGWALDLAGSKPPAYVQVGHPIVSAGVRALVMAQVALLDETSEDLLVAATVLGGAFCTERALRVAGIEERDGERALDQLVCARLLREVASTGTYTVSHDLVRAVLYAELGPARRRRLHRRALALLEAEGAPDAELARHAAAAGLSEQGLCHAGGQCRVSIPGDARGRGLCIYHGTAWHSIGTPVGSGRTIQGCYSMVCPSWYTAHARPPAHAKRCAEPGGIRPGRSGRSRVPACGCAGSLA
jgi:DNA-binding SARP family transcriptional activator